MSEASLRAATTVLNIPLETDIRYQVHLLSYSLEAGVVGAVGDVEDGGHVPGGWSLHLFKQ